MSPRRALVDFGCAAWIARDAVAQQIFENQRDCSNLGFFRVLIVFGYAHAHGQ